MPPKYSTYDSPYKEDRDPFPPYQRRNFYARKNAEHIMGVEDRSFYDAMIAAGIQPSPNVVDIRQPSNLEMFYGPHSAGTKMMEFKSAPATSNLDAFTEVLKSGPMSPNVELQSAEDAAKAKLLWKTLDHIRLNRGLKPMDPKSGPYPVLPPWDKIDLKGLE